MLFFCCTAHFALEFNHYYTTLQATGVPNFANETKKLFGADILISLTDFFGDMVLIYGCWLVWGRNYYVIILPFLTALAGFACLMETMHLLLTLNPSAPVAPASIVPLGTAGYALPLCTNVLVTSLIVGRIWFSPRHASALMGSEKRAVRLTMPDVIKIIVESGALYLVTQLIFVVLFAIKHPAQAIVAVMAVQIYGIAPTLIIIRISLGLLKPEPTKGTGTHISWRRPSARRTQISVGYSTTQFTTAASMEKGDIESERSKNFDEDSNVGLVAE
ncbi:hypothetical protein AcV5_009462 [Taiwanofungus camphoratus]|nr:hypothetical protein AcV5_009462 [Antrodia cinnamomea]KAI0943169.1 hypothetical protein AcV7_002392 [Antrodia cinnamomea]